MYGSMVDIHSATAENRWGEKEETRQFDSPMSNGTAALSREDNTLQSLVDAHCSSAVH